MSDLVRTVRSGIVGLDLALAGGVRLVRRSRAGEGESAILLIRGGPGVGKSVLAQDLALRLAEKVGGDALCFCVEVLPSEVVAQRMGFEGFDPAHVVDLSRRGLRDTEVTRPVLVLGMMDAPTDADGVPDLGGSLLELHRIATARGFAPKVVLIDSLSEGYGLGATVPREVVDGLCKLAGEQGWVLVLVEETPTDAPSPWTFAVDTVLSLRLAPAKGGEQARRELLVTKHRFGGCEPGPHGLLIERERVRVIPPFSAYRHAVRDLDLPVPAKGRSLIVPAKGKVPFPSWFDVADGQGRMVIYRYSEHHDRAQGLAARVGERSRTDAPASSLMCVFYLAESHVLGDEGAPSFVMATLHQFVRGDEWLEAALQKLSTVVPDPQGVASVHIGPTEGLRPYEHKDELAHGVSLLAGILRARGHIVILFGNAPDELLRAGIVSDGWVFQHAVGKTSVLATHEGQSFSFTPDLG